MSFGTFLFPSSPLLQGPGIYCGIGEALKVWMGLVGLLPITIPQSHRNLFTDLLFSPSFTSATCQMMIGGASLILLEYLTLKSCCLFSFPALYPVLSLPVSFPWWDHWSSQARVPLQNTNFLTLKIFSPSCFPRVCSSLIITVLGNCSLKVATLLTYVWFNYRRHALPERFLSGQK